MRFATVSSDAHGESRERPKKGTTVTTSGKEERYAAVVIGTGQGGKPLAAALAAAGHRTAIVERGDLGGTCVNVGCTPTKTMVASARAAHIARRAPGYGVEAGPVSVNMRTVRKRKRDIVDLFRDGSEASLEGTEGLDLIRGGPGSPIPEPWK